MKEILFIIFSSISIIGAFMMVFDKNPIHSILFLALVFLSTSCIFILIGIEFIAMLFLVVYLGALVVLFLFVVMMLNVKILELKERFIKYIPLGGFIGLIFLIEVLYLISNSLTGESSLLLRNKSESLIKLEHKDYSIINVYTNIEYLAQVLYTEYSYFFILAGMILLVAMIGSIILTLNQELINKRQEIYTQIDRGIETSIAKKKLV